MPAERLCNLPPIEPPMDLSDALSLAGSDRRISSSASFKSPSLRRRDMDSLSSPRTHTAEEFPSAGLPPSPVYLSLHLYLPPLPPHNPAVPLLPPHLQLIAGRHAFLWLLFPPAPPHSHHLISSGKRGKEEGGHGLSSLLPPNGMAIACIARGGGGGVRGRRAPPSRHSATVPGNFPADPFWLSPPPPPKETMS